MFFWAFRGTLDQAQRSRRGIKETAHRRCESFYFESFSLSEGMQLVVGWLGQRAVDVDAQIRLEGNELLVTTIPGSENRRGVANERSGLFSANLESGEIAIQTAATSPEQFHYAAVEAGVHLSNDCRLLRQPSGGTISPEGIFAVLQLGAIPAPLSIWRGVKRVPPGSRLGITASGQESQSPPASEHDAPKIPSTESSTTVESRLRHVLPAPGSGPIALFFSGGVDSSLIACELRQLGHRDVTLLNYAFTPDDREADVAKQIADQIGYPLHRLDHDDASIESVLDRIGQDYSYPFGDVSTLPTNAMVHAVSDHVSSDSLLVEGTGADGIVGLNRSLALWRRFAAVPKIIQRGGAIAYDSLDFWRFGGAVRKTCWMLRTLSQMPLLHAAVLSQNSLDDIAYKIPHASKEELGRAIDATYFAALRHESLENRASVLDLLHVCSGIFAAKSFDPIRARGRRVLYPFLTSPMVELATRLPPESKSRDGVDKFVLKEILKNFLPAGLVDRPKRGFEPPMEKYLQMPLFQAYLGDVVLSRTNPVLDFVDAKTTRRMIDYAKNRPLANREVHNFLWSLTFLTAWIQAQR
jgi:asparagine synthase (glutamine-hydrolysing)